MKRALLNVGGFAVYVGLPVIPVAMFWDFFVHKSAATTLSTAAMLVFIIGLSVFKYFLKGDKIPFDVNFAWAFIFVFCLILLPIVEKLLYVSGAGIIGSAAGTFMFKQADKMKKQAQKEKDEDALVDKIVEKLKA